MMNFRYFVMFLGCIYFSNVLSIEIFSFTLNDDNTKAEVLGRTIYDKQQNKEDEETIRANKSKIKISKSEEKLVHSSLELKKMQLMKKALENMSL
jgi:hypothetical protein